jgi:hypothetical protein
MTFPDPQTPFDALVSPTPQAPGRQTVAMPPDWFQGRGLFGGLVTGLMARALEVETPDRTLRSLTAELCGPLQPGPVDVQLDVLRAGNAVTTTTVKLVQGGEVQAHGVGVLGKARPVSRDGVFVAPPVRPPWRELEAIEMPEGVAPNFTKHYEYRLANHFPFSGGQEAVTEGWVRPKRPGVRRDAAFLAGCIDAWWPTLFTVETELRVMVTVAFTFQPFVNFEGLNPEAPLFHRARMVAGSEGYCVEMRELWGEDGRLLALNQQTMALLK